MNIDLAANTGFNDRQGLQNFFLVHRFVHDQTASALTARFGIPVTTFGVSGQAALDAWLEAMQKGARGEKTGKVPAALQDWLNLHADMHNQSYTLLGQSPTVAPDLSEVDFSSPEEFYDWMQSHQAMHDFEYQELGLT